MDKLSRAAAVAQRYALRQKRLSACVPPSSAFPALHAARERLWASMESVAPGREHDGLDRLSLGFEGITSAPAQPQSSDAAGIAGIAARAERAAADAVAALESLWQDGILFAVPKHRVTRSKKRIRQHNKYVKRTAAFATCATCGEKHLPHHLCPFCFPFNNYLLKKDEGKKNKDYEIW
mmetsp:Transcript_21647/g.42516  ORF Transcript_21647/g.42516 Transcript_21647/m.42516 type:complete len:179 (-) Transcript_21647:1022-1558(-)|eukprot:CAMPEP_0171499230 /NCGR_PEP_ID=MMETSP0958-20121227/8315_1 /TAXON_ID=87120 /ORGANISM="Aurantiochytrium limacinum, Strain ATCCMYA-1381" /LENGTH=178 /DNA_ID=CAMNT_0012033767 /DNA_START=34 /DNA_END=570 /DNA_ORIENTATION=+